MYQTQFLHCSWKVVEEPPGCLILPTSARRPTDFLSPVYATSEGVCLSHVGLIFKPWVVQVQASHHLWNLLVFINPRLL